jgi:hypothetical protein
MKAASLARLQRLLGMARNAEALRLAGVMAEIAACRAHAATAPPGCAARLAALA